MNAVKRSKLPPGPKGKFPLGHFFSFRRDSISFLRSIANAYGDIVYFNIGPIRIVLLNHPDYIREVLTTQHRNFVKGRPLKMAKALLGEGLLTSEGEFHRRQSRMIQPAFHRKILESYAPAMIDCTSKLMSGWRTGMKIDMEDEMTRLSTAIAGKTMFDADLENELPDIINSFKTATSLFHRISLPFGEWMLRVPLPGSLKFNRAKAQLSETVNRMIEDRRRKKVHNGDLASTLLHWENEKGEQGGMSVEQVRDEALTLLLTAFDTTSTALTWTWYLLSEYPEAEADMYEEIDNVLQGRAPTASDINELKFTRMVFSEAMRLYPPSYLIPREALEDFPIDKYVVPKGTLVLLSPYLIHHDPRFHPDPEKFNPHNWEKPSRSQNFKYEYFPFSMGPRSCIGEPFAWMQGILVLASIAQSWRVKLVPHHPVELLQRINLRPKNGMMMNLYSRK